MPKAAFHRLSPEKQDKLLTAAMAEFARVSYPDASINRIIRQADISRGAFYLYFEDKQDLFVFLLNRVISELSLHLQAILLAHNGDLFAAMPAVLEEGVSIYRRQPALYEWAAAITRSNNCLPINIFPHSSHLLDPILSKVDTSLLNLNDDLDLILLFDILIKLALRALQEWIVSDDPDTVRTRYLKSLDIIKRGAALSAVCRSH